MEDHLIHGIRHAISKDEWTNDPHNDFVITVIRMLRWQLFSQRQRPFHGRNLYALMVMGRLNMVLDPLPNDEKGRFTKMPHVDDWRRNLGELASSLAIDVYNCLSDEERAEFEPFQQKYHALYAGQLTRHHKGLHPN